MREVSVVLFDGFELLDVFGPVEILSVLPEQFRIEMVAAEAGLIASSQGTRVEATEGFADAATPDIVTSAPSTGLPHKGIRLPGNAARAGCRTGIAGHRREWRPGST